MSKLYHGTPTQEGISICMAVIERAAQEVAANEDKAYSLPDTRGIYKEMAKCFNRLNIRLKEDQSDMPLTFE